MKPRHTLLAVLLAGALAAAFWPVDEADREGTDVVEAVARPARPAAEAAAPAVANQAPVAGAGAQPRFAEAKGRNLFPAQSFRPPPKPVAPPPVLPPPPPMAPPVPFTFVGKWSEDGREAVFLERGSQLVTAHAGDTLPGGWRLDAVGPEGLTFTYVSLNQQRTLRIAP